MQERLSLLKTLVDIAELSLKVVVPIYTLLWGYFEGFVSDFWNTVKCRLWS